MKIPIYIVFFPGSKKDKSQQKSSLTSSSSSKSKEKDIALDLADLDLSRLRLTKKDLETLSTITPNLPKCFQEQLLAKLPPTQARKLSRTLSMQNNSESGTAGSSRVYKRSLSGGREMSEKPGSGSSENRSTCEKDHIKDSTERSEMSSSSYERSLDNRRGSMGRERYGYEAAAAKSRSSSTCKSGDDYSRSLCSSYTSDVSDRYKYYSPYLTKRSNLERPVSPYFDKESDIDRSISPYKYYEGSSSPRNSCFSPVKDVYGRPPSGCLSPPPVLNDGSLRRRSSQRRVSRFLRPDFFEAPLNEENAYLREKKLRERETQNVLREIREKSRDRSKDRRNHSVERLLSNDDKLENIERPLSIRHVRNKSVDRFIETASKESDDLLQRRRRSVSRPREIVDENVSNQILQSKQSTRVAQENVPNEELTEQRRRRSISRTKESTERMPVERFDASDIASKILEELQNISLNTKTNNIPKEINLSNENRPTIIDDSPKDKLVKVKKVKPKDSSLKKEKKLSTTSSSEKQIDSKASSEEKVKKESKLIRPKSYPIKEPEKGLSVSCVKFEESSPSPPEKSESPKEIKSSGEDKDKSRIIRPKSYPNSKITPPKDFKKFSRSGMGISAVMEKLMEKAEKPSNGAAVKKVASKSSSSEDRQSAGKSSDSPTITEQKPVKKVVKKKVVKSDSKQSPGEKATSTDPGTSGTDETPKKDKSPEKKVSKGLLYAIGQKFKNLQENAKNREKKLAASTTISTVEADAAETSPKEADVSVTVVLKKKKSKSNVTAEPISPEKEVGKIPSQKVEEKTIKPDKRSRIDAMIRSLRERSVPRAPVMTESGLIKRAVSVEDVSGAFNKCGVNKVLGLFKKYEKDGVERKVMNARSTSNIERHIANAFVHKERPKSSGFMGKLKRNSGGSTSTDTTRENILHEPEVVADLIKNNVPSQPVAQIITSSKEPCQDCIQELSMEPRKRNTMKNDIEDQEKSKEKRKGLLLDFSKLDNLNSKSRINNNLSNNYNSLSFGTLNNNNSFIGNNCEINQNTLLTPSNENMTNYSSSSKSPQDDCPSSSTFLSPSEEPELCFDNWSVCSEDNYGVSTPSPTVSRLSRTSQLSSPVSLDANNPESVIDRIKRRSFYTRFNEKKPKRQSNIVGPGARDYYRESAAKLRSRPPDRISSPEIDNATNTTPEYLRPLKLSTNISDLKPPLVQVRRRYDDDIKHINPTSTTDFLKPSRSTYNDMLPPMNSISKRYGETDHIRRYEPSYASSLYNTYSPKRRSSFTSNGYVPVSSSTTTTSSDRMNNIEGYATLGRLMNSTQNTAKSPSVGAFRRDHQRTASDFGNLPKSNINLRNSSRSPTNI
ncbi:unnamed protein product [Hermetia illucens]|uniref:Uncharacterized protein n=1 Tax=Hermetia illucens TaxID=343691 RepID=A0A7R8V304_HERIL|nr:unnamed protein product [Hermetia illucens]